jgi:cytochrome c biogenesis protein CcdA
VLSADNFPAMLLATLLLAGAANLYELLCTAGFPMVYSRVLTLNGLSATEYYLYLALYNLIYIIPLLVIVLLVAFALGRHQLSERQGRLLKLMSGVMMMELGLLLLLAPQWLKHVGVAFALLLGAVAVTALAALAERARNKT